ncbi:hypothetical protein Tco_1000505, partial [Tanacetum coccineum]
MESTSEITRAESSNLCACCVRARQKPILTINPLCASLEFITNVGLTLKRVGLPNRTRGLVEVRVRFDPWCIGVRLSVMGRRKRDGENLDKMKEKGDPCIFSSSNLAPQRQQASDYDNSGPAPQLQEVSPPADKTDTSLQELELLFIPITEAAESSSLNIDTLNMHTFYQRRRSDYHWTKDHPLEQVRGNLSK